MPDTPPDTDAQRLGPRRHLAAVVAMLAGVAIGFILFGAARDNGDDVLAPLGLALAAAGVGAEIAVAFARTNRRREPPRLALLLATTATFAGGLLTVAATGLDLQDDVGGSDGQPIIFVVVLAVALAGITAWLAWHVSAVVPSPRASSGPGRHAASIAQPEQAPQP